MLRKLILINFFILMGAFAYSKDYPHINITQYDGLIDNNVFDIYQDTKGFIWFATASGISIYNGISFENFTTNNGLTDNTCYYFRMDFYGRLWIGSNNGTLQYFKDRVAYTSKNKAFLKIPFNGGIIEDIRIEKDSSVTVNFQDRTKFLSIRGEKVKYFDLQQLKAKGYFNNENVIDLVRIHSNAYNIIKENETLLIDSNLNIIKIQKHPQNILINRMMVGRDQEFYIGSKNEIFTNSFSKIGHIPNSIFNQYSLNRINLIKSKLFISTSHGLYIDSELLIKDICFTTVFIDRDSNYWLSSLDKGVYRFSKDFIKSSKIETNLNSKVIDAQKYGDKLMLTSFNRKFSIFTKGVLTYNFDCEEKSNKLYNRKVCAPLFDKDSYFNLCEEFPFRVNGIFSPKPKAILINSNHSFQTFYAKNIDSNVYIINREEVKSISNKHFSTIILCPFVSTQNQFIQYLKRDSATNYESIKHVEFNKFEGNIWYATFKNIYKISANKAIRIPDLSKYSIVKMAFLPNRILYISSDGKLSIISKQKNNAFALDTTFVQNCVWNSFYYINDSSILITTNDFYRIISLKYSNGVCRYDLRIIDNPFIPQLADYFLADKDECYFFRKNDIYNFSTTELYKQSSPPIIRFVALSTKNRRYVISPTLSLPYSDSREIEIKYSVVSLNSNKLTYEYSISSDSSLNNIKWLKADGESISLLKIGSGSYSIKLRAKTAAGITSSIQSFTLIIEKAFWFTWWFWGISIMLLFIIVLLIIKYIVKRKNIENKKEIKYIQAEYRSLNALMNPHFIFNSINNVQGLINSNEKQAASEYLRTISDLIRQNMYNITGDFITLKKEIELIENYLKLEKLRFEDKLNFEINIDPDIDMDFIKIPPLLIQPLVENALKYGIWQSNKKNSLLQINIYYDKNCVCVDIIDNGNGLVSPQINSTEHQSTALNNIKSRLEQLSRMHKKIFAFAIQEIKDKEGNIDGVKASIRMEE